VITRHAIHALFAALLGGLLLLAGLEPRSFSRLMQEDGWAEWASFLAFAIAGVLALHAGYEQRRDRLASLALFGLGAFAIFVAGEEISWGQRLLSFRPPEVFLEHNFQQEANVHNFLKDILDTRFVVAAIALLYGVIAALIVPRIPKLPRAFAPERRLAPWFFAVFVLELSYPFELAGELAELLFGLVILADVVSRSETAERPLVLLGFESAALAGALLLAPIADALTLSYALEHVPAARAELQTLGARLADPSVMKRRIFRKRSVHKRLYTAVRAKYFALGGEEFYLDVWNQPYWVVFKRTGDGRGNLLLYSFGPNRRRDSDVDRTATATRAEDVLAGDDLGVFFELER
jgi:hypothetical protein